MLGVGLELECAAVFFFPRGANVDVRVKMCVIRPVGLGTG